MSKEEKERRCKSCGKLLLDEKVFFCRRCFLEGRNKAFGIAGAVGISICGALALRSNNSDGNNDTTV